MGTRRTGTASVLLRQALVVRPPGQFFLSQG